MRHLALATELPEPRLATDGDHRPCELRSTAVRPVGSTGMSEPRHETAERLLLQFARFGSAVTETLVEATNEPDFVTNAPILVLCLLDLDGPARPGAIADVVGLTSGGTTKLLDRMETAGLIHRVYGAIDTDHRGVQVELTARGRTLLRQATAALLEHLPHATATVKEIVSLVEQIESTAPAD